MFCAEIKHDEMSFLGDIRQIITNIALGKGYFEAILFNKMSQVVEPTVTSAKVVFCVCRSSITEGLRQCFACMEHYHVTCRIVFANKCNKCFEESDMINISSDLSLNTTESASEELNISTNSKNDDNDE